MKLFEKQFIREYNIYNMFPTIMHQVVSADINQGKIFTQT